MLRSAFQQLAGRLHQEALPAYADPLMHANPKKSTDFLADAFALADACDLTQSPNPKPVLPKLAALGGKSG